MTAKIEAQWSDGVWTDISSSVLGISWAHGSPHEYNPSSPTVSPAAGRMAYRGALPQAALRYPLRVTEGGRTALLGFIASPQQVDSVVGETWSWTVSGRLERELPETVDATVSSGTVDGLFADSLIGLGTVTQTRVPTRSHAAFDFAGPKGQLVSRAALAASCVAGETCVGGLAVASPHLTAAPQGAVRLSGSEALDIATRPGHRSRTRVYDLM